MIQVASVDTTGLQTMLNGLQAALVASGQQGDCAQLVKSEARLLATEITRQVAPSDRQRTASIIREKFELRFTALTEGGHAADRAVGRDLEISGRTSAEWYKANRNFLYGISPELDLRDASPELVAKIFPRITKSRNLILDFKHPHKHQRVLISTKVLTKRSTVNKAASIVVSHLGRMKASFAETAQKLGWTSIPQWIAKHLPSPKAISETSGLSRADSPSVTFGSTSRGVSSQRGLVQRAVKRRERAMLNRMRLILSGYSKDVAKGMRPRKHAND